MARREEVISKQIDEIINSRKILLRATISKIVFYKFMPKNLSSNLKGTGLKGLSNIHAEKLLL